MALDRMGYEELPVKRTSWVRIATYYTAVVLLIVFWSTAASQTTSQSQIMALEAMQTFSTGKVDKL